MKCVKRQDEQASRSFVKVVPGTYFSPPRPAATISETGAEVRVQEIRKTEVRHPQSGTLVITIIPIRIDIF